MKVDPSEEKLLWRQLHQLTNILAWPEEVNKAWDLGYGDPFEEEHLDELPDHPEQQPLLTLLGVNVVSIYSHHNTPNGLCGVDGQSQVLMLLK